MKRLLQTLGLVLGCMVVLMPNGANAAGYENIGGVSGYKVYYSDRIITDPSSPGPAVAFYQYSSGRIELGTHNCGGTTLRQFTYTTQSQWNTIWDTGTPDTIFCMWHNSAPAGWNGDLNWD